MKEKPKALLVTTAHKGVFFGYGTPSDAETITLTKARMCVYWSAAMHGVMGLATKGPDAQCRIGPAVPSLILRNVTAVIEVTPESESLWKKEPWN